MKTQDQFEYERLGAKEAIKTVATIGNLFFEKMIETNGGKLPLNIISISCAIQKDPRILLIKVPTQFDIPFNVLVDDKAVQDINCDDYVIATTFGVYSLEEYDGTYLVSYKSIPLDGMHLTDRIEENNND